MVAINDEITCGNCCFFMGNKENHGDTGVCLRYPPTVFPIPMKSVIGGQPQIGFQSVHPPVKRGGFCGEFGPRPDETAKEN